MEDSFAININIVTPDRQLFGAEVFSVVLPGSEGQLEILPGHRSLITALVQGALIVHFGDNQTNLFYVGNGFAEVSNDNLIVLVDEASHYSELDRASIMEEFSAAAALLEKATDDDSISSAQKTLHRAEVRKDVFALIRQLKLPEQLPANSDI